MDASGVKKKVLDCGPFPTCRLRGAHQGSILKSSMLVKCHFGCQSYYCYYFDYIFNFFWRGVGALHKIVLCKVSTSHNEGLSKSCLSQNTVAAICR